MITFNNTKTICDLVKRVGKEYENRVFIRFEKDDAIIEKGYGTFSADTLAVGAYINSQNAKMGHKAHAAILGKCSYEYLTVLLGVTCAGGVAIPMDVQNSIEKMVENLEKADTDILFYDREFSSQADLIKEKCPFIRRFICLQSRKNTRCVTMIHKVYRGEDIDYKVKPEECAMIIFTSGTTGHGKGVMLSHGNIIDNMFCTDDDTEICLNVLPIHHIFCISGDVMLVLRYGSTLCLCDDLSKMLYYIKLFQPTMVRLVPMMAKMLVNRVTILQKQNPDTQLMELKEQVFGSRMNRLTSGGGYLSEALSSALLNLGIVTGQGYGMSECSPKISVPDYERKDKVSSVGHLVTGCKVRIVDGEIQVNSPSVMMGYYNDEELTKEALTEDGWLCTGDLGYLDDEGFLYLSGRKKNLIILSNGENVSPEMIENLFDSDRLIADIIAFGHGEIIAAEVYPNFEFAQANGITDIETAINEIVSKNNKMLPSYAQISECKVRNTPFEKTSSNKIIRKNYFEEKTEANARKESVRRPENENQEKIFELVARGIGNADFGIDENLFSVGLDSMGCTMLISDIIDELDINITLAELMDNPSILELEKIIEAKKNEKSSEAVKFDVLDVYPLTAMQKYFAYIIPGNTTGNLPFAFKLDNSIDLYRLRDAIFTVLNAHPSLKAVVKPTEQKYYAIFRDDNREISISIEKINDSEAVELMQKLIVPFTFRENDNLVHIHLFEGENNKYMFFDVAHFMGDGVTMNILMEDLVKAYEGEEIEAEKYTTYDYILEEQLREKNGIRENNIKYVDNLMEGLRFDRSILNKIDKEDLAEGKYASIKMRFEGLPRKQFLYYGKKHGVSENAIFIAAFNYCIALFSDKDDVFCSSIHSGRTDSRWNRLAGSLFQTYYARYNRIPHEKVDELIKRCGQQIMNTMKCVVSCPKESEMFFQFQGDILEVPQIGGNTCERIHVQLESLPFHMQVMFDDMGYYTELRYWENRFEKEVLEVFLTCFESVLAAMLDETSVRCLKKHLPQAVFPHHFHVEASVINEAVNKTGILEDGVLLPTADEDEKVRVYIFDEEYIKKPFGAWGMVYIMDYEPVKYVEAVQYPYGEGVLYGTGLIGRIMPDGRIDFLNVSGRTVLTDGLHGRKYYDLKLAEDTLCQIEGVLEAECYMAFDPQVNEMSLYADINSVREIANEEIAEFVKEKVGELLVPKYISVKGLAV